MFDDILHRISEAVANELIRKQSNTAELHQTPFHQLIKQPLPPWLLSYFKIILNPQLGGRIVLSETVFDFSGDKPDPTTIKKLKETLSQNWIISKQELEQIVFDALSAHIDFLIDPAHYISSFIFERREKDNIPASTVLKDLDNLNKIIEQWSSHIATSIGVIKPYLAGLSMRSISENELTRVIGSAIEKELAVNPLEVIESDLMTINALLSLDTDSTAVTKVDFSDAICRLLTNRGLTSWTPAVVVERAIYQETLSIPTAIKAIKRLDVFRKHGVLGSESEHPAVVEDEVDNFTNFLDMVTE